MSSFWTTTERFPSNSSVKFHWQKNHNIELPKMANKRIQNQIFDMQELNFTKKISETIFQEKNESKARPCLSAGDFKH